ncbi:hypothetical protein M3Y95_01026800 [Aphelenchoides besseyi]|nr:hypothetical protein M3Y95_01026800 [Aphelenchoides besseyi]
MRGKAQTHHPPCAVCEQEPSKGFHFGVQTCRACASFMRRSIAENRRYVCYRNRECEITSSRNFCRGCRLQKCFRVGMQFEEHPKRSDSVPNMSELVDSPVTSNSTVDLRSICESFPLLERLTCGYRRFIEAQRELYGIDFPREAAAGIRCVKVNKGQWLKVEKASYPFIYAMFDRHYEPIREIEREDRIRLIEDHWQNIGALHRAYLSKLEFPDLNDRRICLFAGGYMELDDLHSYLEGVAPREELDAYINNATCIPIFEAGFKFIKKFKRLQIRDVDTAALICLALWRDAETMGITSDRIDGYKERVMAEWMANLTQRHGEAAAGVRMAKMLCFRLDMDKMGDILRNATLITDILWPKHMNHLLREMSAERDDYLRILRRSAKESAISKPAN